MSAKTYDESQNFDMQEKFSELQISLTNTGYETISSSVIINIL